MPKKIDHDARRRLITDAVCQITLRGGLGAATFREVAAEAGVSVRLVQYYFGTKEGLLTGTQEHVAERSTERLMKWIKATDGSPRAVLAAFLKSFIPADEESRVAALMYVALYNEMLVESLAGETPKPGRETEVELTRSAVLGQLKRGTLAPGVDANAETELITALMPGIGQYVLNQMMTPADAFAMVDYHLDRIFGPTDGDGA